MGWLMGSTGRKEGLVFIPPEPSLQGWGLSVAAFLNRRLQSYWVALFHALVLTKFWQQLPFLPLQAWGGNGGLRAFTISSRFLLSLITPLRMVPSLNSPHLFFCLCHLSFTGTLTQMWSSLRARLIKQPASRT